MELPLRSLALALVVLGATAQDGGERARPARAHYNLSSGGLALAGYDPVAYFPEGGGRPRKGSESIRATHLGVEYRFATERSRTAFLANPGRYEPAYGGWCAWAMADGKGAKVDVDPESFLLEEGRLLLFYDGLLADTKKKWERKGGEACHPVADANWSRLSGEPARRELAHFALEDGLALGGHDPVAYFEEPAVPAEGVAANAFTHEGVTYRFRTASSRASFASEPARYEPRYGGWCAHAMSTGRKVAADPRVFLVLDGDLLLFGSRTLAEAWLSAPVRFASAADARWSALHER